MVNRRLLAALSFSSYACRCQGFTPNFPHPRHKALPQHRATAPRPFESTSSLRIITNLLSLPQLPAVATPEVAVAGMGRWKNSKTRKFHGLGKAVAVAAAVALVAMSCLCAHSTPAFADGGGIPGTAPGCSSTTNPSGYTMVTCDRQGLDRDGRLLGCSSSENCLSTSAIRIPDKLGSPWQYARQTGDADRAFASLVGAVEGTSGANMKTIDTKARYLLAEFPSKVPPGGIDYVEFLVKPEDQIVLYRSVSRDTLYVYPLQQPVSDQGKIKERLEGIRRDLGWDMYTY